MTKTTMLTQESLSDTRNSVWLELAQAAWFCKGKNDILRDYRRNNVESPEKDLSSCDDSLSAEELNQELKNKGFTDADIANVKKFYAQNLFSLGMYAMNGVFIGLEKFIIKKPGSSEGQIFFEKDADGKIFAKGIDFNSDYTIASSDPNQQEELIFPGKVIVTWELTSSGFKFVSMEVSNAALAEFIKASESKKSIQDYGKEAVDQEYDHVMQELDNLISSKGSDDSYLSSLIGKIQKKLKALHDEKQNDFLRKNQIGRLGQYVIDAVALPKNSATLIRMMHQAQASNDQALIQDVSALEELLILTSQKRLPEHLDAPSCSESFYTMMLDNIYGKPQTHASKRDKQFAKAYEAAILLYLYPGYVDLLNPQPSLSQDIKEDVLKEMSLWMDKHPAIVKAIHQANENNTLGEVDENNRITIKKMLYKIAKEHTSKDASRSTTFGLVRADDYLVSQELINIIEGVEGRLMTCNNLNKEVGDIVSDILNALLNEAKRLFPENEEIVPQSVLNAMSVEIMLEKFNTISKKHPIVSHIFQFIKRLVTQFFNFKFNFKQAEQGASFYDELLRKKNLAVADLSDWVVNNIGSDFSEYVLAGLGGINDVDVSIQMLRDLFSLKAAISPELFSQTKNEMRSNIRRYVDEYLAKNNDSIIRILDKYMSDSQNDPDFIVALKESLSFPRKSSFNPKYKAAYKDNFIKALDDSKPVILHFIQGYLEEQLEMLPHFDQKETMLNILGDSYSIDMKLALIGSLANEIVNHENTKGIKKYERKVQTFLLGLEKFNQPSLNISSQFKQFREKIKAVDFGKDDTYIEHDFQHRILRENNHEAASFEQQFQRWLSYTEMTKEPIQQEDLSSIKPVPTIPEFQSCLARLASMSPVMAPDMNDRGRDVVVHEGDKNQSNSALCASSEPKNFCKEKIETIKNNLCRVVVQKGFKATEASKVFSRDKIIVDATHHPEAFAEKSLSKDLGPKKEEIITQEVLFGQLKKALSQFSGGYMPGLFGQLALPAGIAEIMEKKDAVELLKTAKTVAASKMNDTYSRWVGWGGPRSFQNQEVYRILHDNLKNVDLGSLDSSACMKTIETLIQELNKLPQKAQNRASKVSLDVAVKASR